MYKVPIRFLYGSYKVPIRKLDISIATLKPRHRYLNIDPDLAIITRNLGAQNLLLGFFGWDNVVLDPDPIQNLLV